MFSPAFVYDIYNYVVIILSIIMISKLWIEKYHPNNEIKKALFLAIFILLWLGLRPLSGFMLSRYFGDTVNYHYAFLQRIDGFEITSKDFGFEWMTQFFVQLRSAELYFFVLMALYILPQYRAIKRIQPTHAYLLFLMMVTGFLFYSNGVNGIRAGIGSVFFLWGTTFLRSKWKMILLYATAISFHNSMLLPVGAFILTYFVKNYRIWVIWWFISIILSLTFGNFWEHFFSGIGFGDERLSIYLLQDEFRDAFRYTGFRWDFVLYSFSAVVLGWIYIDKKNFINSFYIHLFNTFLIANSFWILVIRSSYSNRFAALSWYLMPIILLYPLLENKLFKKQTKLIGLILFGNIMFTIIMTYFA